MRQGNQLSIALLAKVGLVLANASVLGALAFWTWADFTETRDAAVDKVSAAALVIEEHALRSLLAVDVVLDSVAELVATRGLKSLRSEDGWKELRRIARPLPKTGAVFVVDRAANVVLGTPSHPPPIADLSDRAWVKAIIGGTEDFYIGRALKGRSVHSLFFPIARSIRSRDGTLLGAAQVGIEASYIVQLFSKLDVGPDAHLGLYRTGDGAVVARHPMTEAQLEESVATQPFFLTLANSDASSWTNWIHDRGAGRIVSARRLSGLPLLVTASMPKNQIFADVWRRLLWHTIAAAIVTVALSLLTSLIVRLANKERLLIDELDHRVKNMLTLVSTLIERTREGSGSTDDLVQSLQNRIGSMAGTHALLSRRRWQGVSLADLIRAELAPYATVGNTTIEGPAALLTAEATQPVAMVLHELATNAAKYGALSMPRGQVCVRWTMKPGVEQTLLIDWRETGGPKVVEPSSRGYGSDLIRELVEYELGGTITLAFAADGLWCTIAIPAHWTAETGS